MKIKRIIAVVAAMTTVLTFTVACSKNKDEPVVYETDAYGETVTNKDGEKVTVKLENSSVEYVTDEKGNYVLDKNGEKMTILHYSVTEVDENGNVITNANKEPVTKEFVSSNETTTLSIEEFISNQMTTGKVETLPEGTTIATNKRLFDKKFRDIITTGKFYIEMNMSGNVEGLGMSTDVAFAMNGADNYTKMGMSMAGLFNMTIEMINSGGKTYTVNPKNKIYMEDESANMLDPDELKESLGSSNAKYQKTSIVKANGKTYICEEYLAEDLTYKYYFDQKTEELKRIEFDTGDGDTIIMDVKKFVKNPSDSYFKVPAGYKKVTAEEFEKALVGPLTGLVS